MKILRSVARAACAGLALSSLVVAGCAAETSPDEASAASDDALTFPVPIPPRFFCFDTVQDMTPADLVLHVGPPLSACSSISTVEIDKIAPPAGTSSLWIHLRAETEAVAGAGLRYMVEGLHHELQVPRWGAPYFVDTWKPIVDWRDGQLDEVIAGQPGSNRLWYVGMVEARSPSPFDAIVSVRVRFEAWDSPTSGSPDHILTRTRRPVTATFHYY